MSDADRIAELEAEIARLKAASVVGAAQLVASYTKVK